MDGIKPTDRSRENVRYINERRFPAQQPVRTQVAPAANTLAVHPNKPSTRRIRVSFMLPAPLSKAVYYLRAHRIATRVVFLLTAVLLLGVVGIEVYNSRNTEDKYQLSDQAIQLLPAPSKKFGEKLTLDVKSATYLYNSGYSPDPSDTGDGGNPRFTANFPVDLSKGYTITDPLNQVGFTLKPLFGVNQAVKSDNRLIYPITDKKASKVYTLGAASVKEDILVDEFIGDELSFTYELGLGDMLEAKIENNGSVGVYGPSNALLGNVSTGSDSDAALLQKARQNSAKDKILFTIPPPVIIEGKGKQTSTSARFELSGKNLTIHATNLTNATYPLSIDPSVYIETARKFMRGNNETNVDFDPTNDLIQKSQTTGARIDGWSDSTGLSAGVWGHSMAAAGGYVYRAGGRVDPTMPYIASSKVTTQASNNLNFVMSMPDVRPAGDLYIALIAKDGNNRVSQTGGGWTEYADLREHVAYYKVGTDQGGGNEAASYTFTVATTAEQWSGVILRVKGFNSGSPISGSAATGSSGSDALPAFPATAAGTPAHDATLVIRAAGVDADQPSTYGWLPSGHTRVHSGVSSTDANSAAVFVTTLDTPPLAANTVASTSFTNDGLISDTYGASTIAIRPATVTAGVQSTVEWAQFSTSATSPTVDSPTTGDGVCSNWCNKAAYNLPAVRVGMSMFAYNGFLYAMGGTTDVTTAAAASATTTVWIAKIGANGEPQLWHPTGGTAAYWFVSSRTLPAARSYSQIYAYENKMYLVGGRDTAGSSLSTVHAADILPTGDLSAWSTTGMQSLPDARHAHSVHVYNDVMYLVGGNSSGTLRNTVYYSKLSSTGTMNTWVQTTSFTTARSSFGGQMSTIVGGYIYLAGGCSALTSSYCSTIASDTILASIHADGSIGEWATINNLSNQRTGYSFIGWQNGLYRFGGCTRQNTTSGVCYATNQDSNYGLINPDGEASTVNTSVTNSTGAPVAPCSGADPYSCGIPTSSVVVGNMLNASVIVNGYLYIMGGCTNNACNTQSTGVTYQAIGSDGTLRKPTVCTGGSYQNSFCVSPTSLPAARGAPGVAVFNGRIYVVGGFTGATMSTSIYHTTIANDGSIGAWTTTDLTTIGAEDVSYAYAYARANPSDPAGAPGNLYIFGGCTSTTSGPGCATYTEGVYKCDIAPGGAPSGCTTSGQTQIGTPSGAGSPGLGAHAGAVYANYIYLIGGLGDGVTDLTDTRYAKFDDNNDVVESDGAGTANWSIATNDILIGRRRGSGFGYNGFLYVTGGYDGTNALADIEFAEIDVSTGDLGVWRASSVSINRRWGLTVPVSNSYAYVVGGCTAGAAPSSCSTRTNDIQTFQIYNNDSGAIKSVTNQSDDTFAADTDRIGTSAAVLNGYVYVAGGCTNIACGGTQVSRDVQYAKIDDANGTLGSWSTASNILPTNEERAWGQLEVAGTTTKTLYYIGGQDDTGDEKSDIYYVSTFTSGDITAAWSTASGGIGDVAGATPAQDRTKFGATVWDNRIYVVAGINDSAAVTNTVYISPQLNSGGNISADSWTSDADVPDVARSGGAVTAYANNLYLFGGNDGTNYFNDVQFSQINSDGTVDAWVFTTSTPGYVSDADAFAANGYIYLVGGRSGASTCAPNTLVAPISANTTIASGNNPTGVGEWFETNIRYTGGRYGSAMAYSQGKMYLMGGGCSAPIGPNYTTGNITQTGNVVTGTGGTNWTDDFIGATITYADASTATVVSVTSTTTMIVNVSKTIAVAQTYTLSTIRHTHAVLKSQPQLASYSRMIDTDTDVFPTKWLMNGLDNSIGARWQLSYRSMHDLDATVNPNEDCGTSSTMAQMTTWGENYTHGDVSLGSPGNYIPYNTIAGGTINCARYFYFNVSIDASQTFGYPEDVTRGPTLSDLTLIFRADPSKRLRHGKTFTGGEKQPLDTPF